MQKKDNMAQTLNTATTATGLLVGDNIVTGDLQLGDSITTGALSVGSSLTSGELTLGFSPSRTADAIVGHESATGNVELRSAGEVNVTGHLKLLTRGSVTQITSDTTGVELNAPAGVITTVNLALGGHVSKTFVVTNSYCSSNSIILGSCEPTSSGSSAYVTFVSISDGSFSCRYTVSSGGMANQLKISFIIL